MKDWGMDVNMEMAADMAAGAIGYLLDLADQIRDALQGEQAQKAAGAIRGALVDACMVLTSPRVAGAIRAGADALATAVNVAVLAMLATVAWMAGGIRAWLPIMLAAVQAMGKRAARQIMRGTAHGLQISMEAGRAGRQIMEEAGRRIRSAWRFRAEVIRECR